MNLLFRDITDFASKVSYCITNLLIESVNASVSYEYVNTWGYGNLSQPDKLKGLVGALVRNEIDIGGNFSFKNKTKAEKYKHQRKFEFLGTVLFITADRLPYIEYLSETIKVHMAFVFRPPPLSQVSNIYGLPFNTTLWICVLFMFMLCTTIIGIIYFFSKQKNDGNFYKSDLILLAIATMCQMGGQIIPKTASAKIAMVKITFYPM